MNEYHEQQWARSNLPTTESKATPTLNECMIFEMMKVMIDWISHLSKLLTLFMNDESFAPMLSLNMIDWIEP